MLPDSAKEFTVLGLREIIIESCARICIIPARTTEGVIPVSAMKKSTAAMLTAHLTLRFIFSFFSEVSSMVTTTAKCVPLTTRRCDIPSLRKSRLFESYMPSRFPSRTADKSPPACPSVCAFIIEVSFSFIPAKASVREKRLSRPMYSMKVP